MSKPSKPSIQPVNDQEGTTVGFLVNLGYRSATGREWLIVIRKTPDGSPAYVAQADQNSEALNALTSAVTACRARRQAQRAADLAGVAELDATMNELAAEGIDYAPTPQQQPRVMDGAAGRPFFDDSRAPVKGDQRVGPADDILQWDGSTWTETGLRAY